MLHAPAASAAPFAPLAPAVLSLAADIAEPVPRSFMFGPYLLQPERQLLLRDGDPVRIGGRALDILTLLVEQPGALVSKQQLLDRVWPQLFVEEANLKANVALLRRVLGECHAAPRYIATIVGRGYRFVSPVRTFGGQPEALVRA